MRIIEYENLKWIDIVQPGDQEANFLERQFGFHPLIVGEIKTPTYHPVIESYGLYLFLILHFPNFNLETQKIQNIEVDFLITKDSSSSSVTKSIFICSVVLSFDSFIFQ